MRKFYIILTGILFTLLFATCKQFTTDIDDYLGYWSSEAFIRSSTIDKKTYNDANGMASVASEDDVTVTLKIQNPKSFWFVMPPASKPKKIVEFAHFAGPKPEANIDYKLTQPLADTLKLVYYKSFLEKAEWGEKDISSTITLYADDGREFKQTFTIPLKANTPPPKPSVVLAKTKPSPTSPSKYVLCLRFASAEMTRMVTIGSNTVPVHKDISKITINGFSYPLLYKGDNSDFQKPDRDSFIESGNNVERLDSSSPNVPSGAWVLYFNTGVVVQSDNPQTSYTVTLSDVKGIVSDSVTAELKEKFKVEFNAQDGAPAPGTQYIPNGGKVAKPSQDPTRLGYSFGGWYASPVFSGSAWNFDNDTVTGNMTLYAKWTKKDYTVAFSVVGGGTSGTLKARPEGGFENTTGSVSVAHGASVTFTADPAESYEVDSWSSNVTVTPSTDKKEAKLLNVTETTDKTVWVKFKKVYKVTFNVVGGTGGTLKAKVDGSNIQSGNKVEHGKKITFTAVPDTGYEVKEWTVDGNVVSGHTSTSYELSSIDSNKTVKVKFKLKEYTVKFSVAEGEGKLNGVYGSQNNTAENGHGEMTLTNVPHGSTITFTATPEYGWKVKDWTASAGTLSGGGTGTTATLTVTDNATVKVKFKKITTVNGGDGAWKLLKKVVEIADNNAIITINGEIEATNDTGNSGEITLGTLANKLTIQSGSSAVLDANGKSRIFKVEGGKTLTLKNLTLQNGAVPNPPYGSRGGGGGILVDGSTVRMSNCTIKDCKAGEQKTSGGAICIDGAGAKVYIAGGEISGNRANRGGGISISGGKLYINTDDNGDPNDSSTQTNITNNLVADNGWGYRGDGGAIYSESNSELKLHNTKISRCGSKTPRNPSTTKGGGLYIDGGTAVLTSVEISHGIFETIGGWYQSVRGGAIYSENADVTLGKSGTPTYSCYIHHNTIRGNDSSGAFEGGGIYSYRGTLKIYGGKIEFNKVEGHLARGGGIAQDDTNLLLDGTVITDNTASYRGGGVDGLNIRSFTMEGSATVTPSTGEDANKPGKNDVYLPTPLYRITIVGELTPVGGTAARITPDDYGTTQPVLAGAITTGSNYTKFTVTPNGTELWKIDNNGKLKKQ